eukprot:2840230-Amphidinium_carterae.1
MQSDFCSVACQQVYVYSSDTERIREVLQKSFASSCFMAYIGLPQLSPYKALFVFHPFVGVLNDS